MKYLLVLILLMVAVIIGEGVAPGFNPQDVGWLYQNYQRQWQLDRQQQPSPPPLTNSINKSNKQQFRNLRMDIAEPISQREATDILRLIVPGTKWCGPGNIARNDDDLGIFERTDRCCRSHDKCEGIPANKQLHGLINRGQFTIMNCECDQALHLCLKLVNI